MEGQDVKKYSTRVTLFSTDFSFIMFPRPGLQMKMLPAVWPGSPNTGSSFFVNALESTQNEPSTNTVDYRYRLKSLQR